MKFLLFGLLFITVPRIGESQKLDLCIIDFANSKINDISLKNSSFKEIEEVFGGGVYSKKVHERFSLEMNFFPKSKYILEYPELGLKFETSASNKRISKRVISRIIITTSECKSPDSIGVGSSYFDIKDKYPDAANSLSYEISDQKKFTKLIYNDQSGSYVQFRAYGDFTANDFKVEEVIIQ